MVKLGELLIVAIQGLWPWTASVGGAETGGVDCYEQFDREYQPHPDMHLNTPEVIQKYGYPLETHKVTTTDAYILTLFRIPPNMTDQRPRPPPVFLNHGLFGNGHIWLLQHGQKNLAFKLSSEGYDVWLGNVRGTKYSQEHEQLDPNQADFWDFSFHEMGILDVPSILRYITAKTQAPKVFYIGHSMGTSTFFIAMSRIPELNDLIATAVLYAPVAFISNTHSIGRIMAPMVEELYNLSQPSLQGKFYGKAFFKDLLGESLGELCAYRESACGICKEVARMLFGEDPPQMNYTLQSLLFSHVPDWVSLKTMAHYMQLINSGKFAEFDYGSSERNEEKYGIAGSPPDYNLTSISAPMFLFWGQNDNLAVPKDVNLTIAALHQESVQEVIRVGWDLWTHKDFIRAIDADKYVYDPTIDIFKNYQLNSNSNNKL